MYKTKEQRRREIKKLQMDKIKAEMKTRLNGHKERNKFPAFIKMLNNRLSRVDPWSGVPALDSWNCAFITYYKLKQHGIEKLRIRSTNNRAWVEFMYDDEWWIFDPAALQDKNLGPPVKREKYIGIPIERPVNPNDEWMLNNKNFMRKLQTTTYIEFPEYNDIKRIFYNIDDFYNTFLDKLDYDFDEAKIAAMKDKNLNLIFRSHI